MVKRNYINKLVDRMTPDVQAAFLKAIADIKSDAQMTLFVNAYAAGNVQAALEAISLGAEYFAPLDAAMSQAYAEGGAVAMQMFKEMAQAKGVTVIARFNARNPRAEEGLARHSSRMIVEIADDIRDVVRERLASNMASGVDAQRAALDIIGRRVNGRGPRKGGIIGLTNREAAYAHGGVIDGRPIPGARGQLLSGNPSEMRAYLGRTRRDRRYDKIVEKAIAEKRPVRLADVNKITDRYADRLLKLRGERIARTELLGAMSDAQNASLQQLVDEGKVRSDQITRTWDSSEDQDTRDSHRAMEGQSVKGPDAPFTTGAGYLMRFPGDSALGAPVGEIVNCRCRIDQDIDWIAGLQRGD